MNYIEKIFKKSGLISILESLIIALLGIILIIEPEGTLKFITCSLGVIFILAGLYKIINYFLSKGKYNFYISNKITEILMKEKSNVKVAFTLLF